MMKTSIKIVLIATLLFCVSCFKIIEDVRFNEDGSGLFAFYLEFDNASNFNQYKSDVQAEEQFNTDNLHNLKGIQQVQYIIDTTMHRFGVQFQFSSIVSLNIAMQELFNVKGISFFEQHDNQISRKNNSIMEDSYVQQQLQQSNLLGLDHLFQKVSYETHYSIPYKVDSCSNKFAKVIGNNIYNQQYLFIKDTAINQSLTNIIYYNPTN